MVSNSDNPNSNIQQLAENALVTVKVKLEIRLVFSENTLQQFELILEQAHESHKHSSPSEGPGSTSLENTVQVWGSYLGEGIGRSMGGDWIENQKDTLLRIGSRMINPLG